MLTPEIKLISQPAAGHELSKDFCLPGCTVEYTCPHCGRTSHLDLGEHFLDYPKIGMAEELTFCCEECDEELGFKITVKITVEL